MALEKMYQDVRDMRTKGGFSNQDLELIFNKLKADYPKDWLLSLELLELSPDSVLSRSMEEHLVQIKESNPSLSTLIKDGMDLLNKPKMVKQ